MWGKNMKKILLGSIVTVVILILVSFTSVVGYRSVESNIRVSPLFNIRSSRAIDEESRRLTNEYVGKGEEINIPIPKHNPYGYLINRALNRLKEMDRDTVKRLLDNKAVIYRQFEENPIVINYLNKSYSNIDDMQTEYPTYGEPPCFLPTIIEAIEGFCLLEIILAVLLVPIAIPLLIILGSALLVSIIALFLWVGGYFIYNSFINRDCFKTLPGPFSCLCEP